MKNVESIMLSPSDRYRAALRTIQEEVNRQSNDDFIWEEPPIRSRTALEIKLVHELRAIHNTIERFTIPIFERVTLVQDQSE